MSCSSLLTKLSAAVDEKESKGLPFGKKKESTKEEVPKNTDEKEKVDNIPKEEGSEKTNEEKPVEGVIKEDVPVEAAVEQPQPTQMPQNALSLIMDFFSQNPNPQDADFHAFAEQNGMDVHQAETMVYTLATKAVNLIRGGASVEAQLDPNTVDPNELQMGIELEYKHTPDASIAKKIALDNLSINPNFYTSLKQMLDSMNQEANAAAVPMNKNDQYEGQEEAPDDRNEIPVGANNATEG